jgi:hypothetical protein
MHHAVRVAMGFALLAATGITRVQTNPEATFFPRESPPSRQQRSNSGTVLSKAMRAEVSVGLYFYAVVVAKRSETWVLNTYADYSGQRQTASRGLSMGRSIADAWLFPRAAPA